MSSEDAGGVDLFAVEGTANLVKAYASIGDDAVRSDVLALVASAARLANEQSPRT